MIRALSLRLSLWRGIRRQKLIRQARSKSSSQGWLTRRARDRAALRPHHDFPANDWDACPCCGFILVACDCDSSPGRFGPRPDGGEARPVHTMTGV